MLGQSRIGLKPLAALSRRLALSLGAGVDVRTVWVREANASRGVQRRHFAAISNHVARGQSISDALADTGAFFPDLFRELVRVGEATGHLPEICRRLAEHYEHQLRLRRVLMASLAWPLFELFVAVAVVGLLIWLMGVIPQSGKDRTDMLGFGLTGTSGLLKYLAFLMIVGVAGFAVFRATTRGALWALPVQQFLRYAPQLGQTIETLAMSRLSWAMYVTLNSGMDLKEALRMSLASTQNVLYTRHIRRITASIAAGREVHEAFRSTGAFPIAFLDAVQVGEQSGQLVESMEILATQFHEEAQRAMTTLTVILGGLVAALIACVIIFLIFRIFGFYLNSINDALNAR